MPIMLAMLALLPGCSAGDAPWLVPSMVASFAVSRPRMGWLVPLVFLNAALVRATFDRCDYRGAAPVLYVVLYS
eukprot:8500836-Pyramimonas_sp.AAC.1